MKRALLAVVLLAALTACGDTESGTSPGTTPESTTTTTPAPTTTTTTNTPTTTTTTTAPPPPPDDPVVTAQTPAPKKPPVQPKPADPTPAAPADAYYKNCDAARAAGAAPLHRGDPGYRAGLDRDGDGVACEAG